MATPSSSSSSGSALNPREVQSRLAQSDSSTLYLNPGDLDDASVAALLENDPPLHAERDYVRLKWSVRQATPAEVDASKAFADARSGTSTPSGVAEPEAEGPELQAPGMTPSTPGASTKPEGITTESQEVPDPDDQSKSGSRSRPSNEGPKSEHGAASHSDAH
jgi:hypothetical protein